MPRIPCHFVSGQGLGISYTSYTQIGDLRPAGSNGHAKVGVFYNAFNGNCIIQDHAVQIDEASGAMPLFYTFNTQGTNLENAQAFSLKKRFLSLPNINKNPPDSSAVLLESDGHETTYQNINGELTYYAQMHGEGRPFLRLMELENYWVWFDPKTQTEERYDLNGYLTQRIDAAGRVTQFSYQNNELAAVTGPSGTTYTFERSNPTTMAIYTQAPGQIKQLLQTYTYDALGRVVQTTLPSGYQLNYEYFGNSFFIMHAKQSDGTDVALIHHAMPDPNFGYPVQIEFNDTNDPVMVTVPTPGALSQTITYGSAIGLVFDLGLNSDGTLASLTEYLGYATNGAQKDITQFAYANGQLASITAPDGSQELFQYEPLSFMIQKHTQPNGRVVEYLYHGADTERQPLIIKTEHTEDPNHPLITRYVWDENFDGQNQNHRFLRFVISPTGLVTEFRPQPNTSFVGEIRHYQQAFDLSHYLPRSAPVILAMNAWVAAQNPALTTLKKISSNSRGQAIISDEYAQTDAQGEGVINAAMAETNRVWDIHGMCLEQDIRQELDPGNPAPAVAIYGSTFDDLQRLTAEANPLPGDNKTTHAYDDSAQTVTTTLPSGLQLQSVWDRGGCENVSSQIAPAMGVTRTTNSYRNSCNQPLRIERADGTIAFQIFDKQNRLAFTISPMGRVVGFFYDRENRVITTTQFINTINIEHLFVKYPPILPHCLPSVALFVDNILPGLQSAVGNLQTYKFNDQSQRLHYEVDAKNYVIEHLYDTRSNKLGTIRYANPLSAAELATLKAGGVLARNLDLTQDRYDQNFYDDENRLKGHIDADGWVKEFRYDNFGFLIETVNYSTPNRNPRSPSFDAMRPVAVPASDAHTYYFNNLLGKPELTVDAQGYITVFEYNSRKLCVSQTRFCTPVDSSWYQNVAQRPTLPAANPEDRTKTFTYDLMGREIGSQCTTQAATEKQFDEVGHVILARQFDVRDPQNADADKNRATQDQFDQLGQLTNHANPMVARELAAVEFNPNLSPAQKQQQELTIWQTQSRHDIYDPITGLKTKSINSQGGVTIYYYDQDRNLAVTISPSGSVFERTVNSFCQEIQTREYAQSFDTSSAAFNGGFRTPAFDQALAAIASDELDIIVNKQPDARGDITQITDGEGYQTTFAFNAFREVISEARPVAGTAPSLVITKTRNPRGLVTALTSTANGQSITEQREYENPYAKETKFVNALGVETDQTYDRLGNLATQSVNGVLLASDEYDAFRQIKKHTNALGVVTLYDYAQATGTQIIHRPVADTDITVVRNVFSEMISRAKGAFSPELWEHAPNGAQEQYTDQLGNETLDTYYLEGWHQSRTLADGTKSTFSRDLAGRLLQDETQNAAAAVIARTAYAPNPLGVNASVTRWTDITNNQTVLTQNQYDRRRLLTQSVQDPSSAAYVGLDITIAQTHNGQGARQSFVQGDVQTADQLHVNFSQDGFNRSVSKTIDPVTAQNQNALAIVLANQLDNLGRVVVNIDPRGNKNYLFYDQFNNKRFKVNALGAIVEWRYDLQKRLTARIDYDAFTATPITDATTLAQIITYAQNIASNQDSKAYYFYDDNDRECFHVNVNFNLTTQQQEGYVSETRYNAADKRVLRHGYAKAIDVSNISNWKFADLVALMSQNTDSQDRITYYLPDAKGQERFSIDPLGVVQEQVFNSRGRIIQRIKYANFLANPQNYAQLTPDAFSAQVIPSLASPGRDRISFKVFDNQGKPTFTVDPEGGVVYFNHDAKGRLIYQCEYADKITPAATYDEVVAQVLALQPTPGKDSIKQFNPDKADRVQAVTDALNYVDQFTFFAHGAVATHTDRKEAVFTYQYDRAKRMVLKTSPAIAITDTVFDPEQEQITTTTTQRTVSDKNDYDSANNVIAITKDAGGSTERTFNSAYDAENALESTAINDVEVDDPTQAASFQNRPVATQNITTAIARNAKGSVVVKKSESGLYTFMIYDAANRKIFEVTSLGAAKQYLLNCFGEIVKLTEYNQAINLNFAEYQQTGIPVAILLAALQPDANLDRSKVFTRDLRGLVLTQVSFPAVPCYIPGSNVVITGNPTLAMAYNAFSEATRIQNLRFPVTANTPAMWTDKLQWFDLNGKYALKIEKIQLTANSQEVYRVTRTLHNAWQLEEDRIQLVTAVAAAPALTASLDQIDAQLPYSDADRHTRKLYDPRKLLRQKIRLNVQRSVMVLDPQTGRPSLQTQMVNLVENFAYNPTELLTQHQFANGLSEVLVYNLRGNVIAKMLMPRTAIGPDGKPRSITPLSLMGVNAHGQQTAQTRYKYGADTTAATPTPLQADSEDQKRLTTFDSRGKNSYRQDAEAVVTAVTFTASGKGAREFVNQTDFPVPGVTQSAVVHVDEKRTGYDSADRVTSKSVLRDNLPVEKTFLRRNTFGDVIGEGADESATDVERLHDGAGREWNTKDRNPTITLGSLDGKPTLSLQATKTDLSQVTDPLQVSALLNAAYTDVQKSEYNRAPDGRVLEEILPSFDPGVNTGPTNIVLQIAFNNGQLSWPPLQQHSSAPVFSIGVRGAAKQELQINYGDEVWSVDVSHLPTDIYDLELNYFLIDPRTQAPSAQLQYITTGSVQIITNVAGASTHCVSYVEQGHLLYLAGNTSNSAAVELYQNNQLIMQLPLQPDPASGILFVDTLGKNLVSGTYQVKPVNGAELGLPLILYTDVPSPTPIAREIYLSGEVQFMLSGQDAELDIWSALPAQYQNSTIGAVISYVDSNRATQTYGCEVLPNSAARSKRDANNNIIQPNITLPTAAVSIASLSLSVKIADDEFVLLYSSEVPEGPARQVSLAHSISSNHLSIQTVHSKAYKRGKAQQVHEDGDFVLLPENASGDVQTYYFAQRGIVYLSSIPNFEPVQLNAYAFEYFDVSQDSAAVWAKYTSLVVAPRSKGLSINTTALLPGVYPLRSSQFTVPDQFQFTVARNAFVYSSNNAPQLREPSPGVARKRSYEYSAQGKKPVVVVDANGNRTDRAFNDHDDLISETSPPVNVQSENGAVIPAQRLTRLTGYDTMNAVVGTTDPKNNVTGIARNEAGQETCTVLPDGSFDAEVLFDGLERPATYTNMAGQAVGVKHNHENSVIARVVPNDDPLINNGQPIVSGFGYDEKQRRNKEVDPAGNQTLQNRDPLGNSVATILPAGQVTLRQFARANLCIKQIDADGVTMTWGPDPRLGYFGLAGTHTDRSGASYQYAYDFMANRTRSISSGGNHGNHAEIVNVSFWYRLLFLRGNVIRTVPNGGQDLQFVWVAGLLLAVIDNAMQQTSQYGYDAEGNRIMVTVTRFDGSVLRSASIQLDGLYRPVTAVDSGLTVGFGHDANDNLIYKIFSLVGDPPQQFFSSVDVANRTLVSEGELVNGVPTPTAIQGVQLGYALNRRVSQTTIAANGQPSTSNIAYWATGDVQSIAAPDATSVYHNAPAGGQVSSIVVTAGQVTRHLTGTNPNGWLAGQQQWLGNSTLQIDTSSVSAPTGAVLSQTTQDNTSNPPVNYGFDYGMVDFDQQMPSIVTGRSSEKYGTKYTQSMLLYDVNGNNNALIGSDQYVQNGNSPQGIAFTTPWDGSILQKAKITYEPYSGVVQTVTGRYFYTPLGQYLTAYTQDNLETAAMRDYRERAQDRATIEMVENEEAEPEEEKQETIRVADTATQVQTGIIPVAQNGHSVSLASTSAPNFFKNRASFRSLMSHLEAVKAAGGAHFDDMNPLAAITNKNFTGAASVYTVQSGDTFASIAASQMTNVLYASTLAMVNGYSSANDTPQVNDQLKIPPYVPFKSDDGTHTPADKIITAIIGPIYPQLQFAQPKPKHHSCIKEIIEVVISVVAVMVAPEITAAILGTQIATTTAMVADGIAAATVDAGLQGVGVGVGALDNFSVEDVLAAAVGGAIAGSSTLSGISSYKNVTDIGSFAKQTAEIMVLNGTESTAEQLSYMALGLQSKFDFRAVVAAMAEGVASSMTGTAFANPTTTNRVVLQVLNAVDDVATAYLNGVIGAAIYGANADFEGMAIQAIGSFVGQETGGEAVSVLKSYVAAKAAERARPVASYFHAQSDGQGISQSPSGYCAWDGRDHSEDDPTNYSSSDYSKSVTTPDTKQPNSSTAPLRVNDPQSGVPDWFSDSFNQYMQPVDQSLGFTGASNGSVTANAQTAAMMSQYFFGGGAGGADSWVPKSMAAILLGGGVMSLPSAAPASSLSGGGLFSSPSSDLAKAKIMAEISNDIYNPSSKFTDAHLLSDTELKQLGLNPSEFTDASQGFYAGLYQLKDGSYVVAYRGSQSLASWGTDVKENVLGENALAYQEAANLGVKISAAVGKNNLAITGHSLGGGEAAIAALVTGSRAVIFNAAGISDATLAYYHVSSASANNLITSYQVENQILELGQRYVGLPPALGQTVTLPSGFSPLGTLFTTRSIPSVIVDAGYLHTMGVVQADINDEYSASVKMRS